MRSIAIRPPYTPNTLGSVRRVDQWSLAHKDVKESIIKIGSSKGQLQHLLLQLQPQLQLGQYHMQTSPLSTMRTNRTPASPQSCRDASNVTMGWEWDTMRRLYREVHRIRTYLLKRTRTSDAELQDAVMQPEVQLQVACSRSHVATNN